MVTNSYYLWFLSDDISIIKKEKMCRNVWFCHRTHNKVYANTDEIVEMRGTFEIEKKCLPKKLIMSNHKILCKRKICWIIQKGKMVGDEEQEITSSRREKDVTILFESCRYFASCVTFLSSFSFTVRPPPVLFSSPSSFRLFLFLKWKIFMKYKRSISFFLCQKRWVGG